MADYYDISSWSERPWYGTKGTRNKSVVHNPITGFDYYFKTSLKKPDKDYKYEFWSEIVASEIGRFLGFNVLRYDIASKRTEVGCISKFMNNVGESELTEGIQYLTGYNSAYKPERSESKKDYTFQFICKALESFDFKNYINEIIKIIIFDSLIGNSDRHQENWGIITYNRADDKTKNPIVRFFTRFYLSIHSWLMVNHPVFSSKMKMRIHHLLPNKFAPIYDNGSCLGRENLDGKVLQLLKDNIQLIAYIKRGQSEIHWNQEKKTHFELIQDIMNLYPSFVKAEINRVKSIYDQSAITKIINEVDKNLPPVLCENKLPDERKELMIKIVSLRYNELIKLLN